MSSHQARARVVAPAGDRTVVGRHERVTALRTARARLAAGLSLVLTPHGRYEATLEGLPREIDQLMLSVKAKDRREVRAGLSDGVDEVEIDAP